MAGRDFDKTALTVRPGKVKIELTNTDRNLSGLILHTEELPQELTLEQLPLRLSGIQLLHHPDYKRLFGDRGISERERVKIRAITIIAILNDYTRYQALPGNAYPEALPP